MVTFPAKERLVWLVLIALIIGFFAIPLVALCVFDCKIFNLQKAASVLLFFFR